jgi:O-antigen biosynthesis protein
MVIYSKFNVPSNLHRGKSSFIVHLPPVIMLSQVQHYIAKINHLLTNQPPQSIMNDRTPHQSTAASTPKVLYLPSAQAEPVDLTPSRTHSVAIASSLPKQPEMSTMPNVPAKEQERLLLVPNLSASEPTKAQFLELLQQGNLLFQQGQLEAAISAYRQALQLDSNSVEAHQYLAQALSSQGNLEEAAVCYRRAIELVEAKKTLSVDDRNNTTSKIEDSTIEDGNANDHVDEPLPWFEEAAFHLQQGKAQCNLKNWDAAISACQQAIQFMSPKTAEAFHILGQAHQGKGNLDEAKRFYNQALRLQPKVAEVYAYLASVYTEQQDLPKALECYKQAIGLKPDFAGAYWAMGDLWQRLGDRGQATNCWYQALQLEPDWGTAREHWRLGIALTEQGKLDEAVVSFTQAIRFESTFAEAYHNLGIVLGKQGKWQDSLRWHRQAVEHDAENPQLLAGLGRALVALEHWEEASSAYQRITQLNLGGEGYAIFQHALTQLEYCQRAVVAKSYYHMGEGLSQQEKWQEAISCYRQAAERNPKSAQIHAGLGKALAKLDQWDAAVAAYQQAMELAPDRTEYYLEFGDVLIRREQLQKRQQTARQTDFQLNKLHANAKLSSSQKVEVKESKLHNLEKPEFTLL